MSRASRRTPEQRITDRKARADRELALRAARVERRQRTRSDAATGLPRHLAEALGALRAFRS